MSDEEHNPHSQMVHSVILQDEACVDFDAMKVKEGMMTLNEPNAYHPSQQLKNSNNTNRSDSEDELSLHQDYFAMSQRTGKQKTETPTAQQQHNQVSQPFQSQSAQPNYRLHPDFNGTMEESLAKPQVPYGSQYVHHHKDEPYNNTSHIRTDASRSKLETAKLEPAKLEPAKLEQPILAPPSQIISKRPQSSRGSIGVGVNQFSSLNAENPTQLLIQKKREAYQNMKINEEKSKHLMDTHRELTEDIYTTLERRAQISTRGMNMFIDYLKEYIANCRSHVLFLQTKTPIKAFCDQDSSLYPLLTNAIQNQLDQQSLHQQQVQHHIQQVQSLIDKQLMTNIMQFQQKIRQNNENYQSCKKHIFDKQMIVKKYSEKLARIYNEMMQTQGVHKKPSKDLFYSERKYLSALMAQMEVQQLMGSIVYNYMNDLVQIESTRYKQIQDCLSILQVIMGYDSSFVKNLHAENEVTLQITVTQTEIIQRTLGTNIVELPEIKYFLCDYLTSQAQSYIEIDSHSLIKGRANNVLQDVGSLLADWRQVRFLITEDNHLVVLENKQVRHKFTIQHLEVKKKSANPCIVSIKSVTPGIIFSKTEEFKFKFLEPEQFDQLLVYLMK